MRRKFMNISCRVPAEFWLSDLWDFHLQVCHTSMIGSTQNQSLTLQRWLFHQKMTTVFLIDLILYVPVTVNIFSVMSGLVFLSWTSIPVRLEPATPRSRRALQHALSHCAPYIYCMLANINSSPQIIFATVWTQTRIRVAVRDLDLNRLTLW